MFRVPYNFTRTEGIGSYDTNRSENNLISENRKITKIRPTRSKDQIPRLNRLGKVNRGFENNE